MLDQAQLRDAQEVALQGWLRSAAGLGLGGWLRRMGPSEQLEEAEEADTGKLLLFLFCLAGRCAST